MTIFQDVVLALIQGLTEFLPVSSSAHLILPSKLLGWPDQGIAFDTSVHIGTLMAIIIYYRNDLKNMIVGTVRWLMRKESMGPDARMLVFVLLATIPVGLVGLVVKDFVENNLRSELVIAIATIIFGLLLWAADVWNKKYLITRLPNDLETGLFSTALSRALVIGCAQAVALIPGVSRSGITMTAGYFLGLKPEQAAKFSFLLSIPVIVLAAGLSVIDMMSNTSGGALEENFVDIIIGIVVSFVSALIVIQLFMKWLSKTGLFPYVVYRIFLGAALIACLYY